MTTEYATLSGQCGKCSQEFEIEQVWEAGGVNDYGGFILSCTQCGHVFDVEVGRDINMSSTTKGARVLERYDRDVEGDRERVLEKHGLNPH